MKPDYSYKTEQKVKNFIKENNITGHGDSVIVGLSGGADSVCLFLLLNKLKDELNIKLHAVHVNHCIRKETALRDEKFSYELSERYSVPFMAYEINVPEMAAKEGLTTEEAGRKARYACFYNYAEEIARMRSDATGNGSDMDGVTGGGEHASHGSIKIAVAHHMDDQAETVIFNMIRGSGVTGIGGMEPVSGNIVRPLLCLTKAEILKYLEFIGQDYCIDETNSDNDYSRNQIRNVVIPALEKLQPCTSEHIAGMSDDVRDAKEFIDEYTAKLFKEAVMPVYANACINDTTDNAAPADGSMENITGYRIDINALKKEKPFIAKELIILTLKELILTYKDITKIHINDVYSLTFKGRGKKICLPYGLYAFKERDAIVIGRNM